jgi:thiamine kinase-like enzyme
VNRGLREAFGTTQIDRIEPLMKGLTSALKFRIVVGGSTRLLKIIMRVTEMNDPARQFAHMAAGAEAGVAPRVRYTSPEDGICITDFIEASPFSVAEARRRVPRVLRRLHMLPPFAKAFNYATAQNGFIARFRAANLLPKDDVEQIFARYAKLAAVYPCIDADMVSCHNDLKPENLLFDGDRVWLVDWEASLLNDRYFDLGVVANFALTNESEERAYLQEYFGRPPDEYELARFFLMRQILHLLSAAVFLLLGCEGKPVDEGEAAPDFREFHDRIWAGNVDLADHAMKVAYGRVHWRRLLENLRQARFDESLTIVRERGDSALLLPG